MPTRERLIRRREELSTQLEQARANVIAIQGAVLDLNFLIKEDEESEAKMMEANSQEGL